MTEDDAVWFAGNRHRSYRIREIERLGRRRRMLIVDRRGVEHVLVVGEDFALIDRDTAIGTLLSAVTPGGVAR
jgi:hypothetical protein